MPPDWVLGPRPAGSIGWGTAGMLAGARITMSELGKLVGFWFWVNGSSVG